MKKTTYKQIVPYMPHLLETVIVESEGDDDMMMEEEIRLRELGFATDVTVSGDTVILRAVRLLTAD